MTTGTGAFSLGREAGDDGAFERQRSRFRDTAVEPEPGRYHLYVSWACPWAHRTIIGRRLKGLEDAIGLGVVDPVRDRRGWAFTGGEFVDDANGFRLLADAYAATDPGFDGRFSVPVLWDREAGRIVKRVRRHPAAARHRLPAAGHHRRRAGARGAARRPRRAWRFFTTLVRFDAVHAIHFKCSLQKVTEYEHLWPYLRDLFQWPGIAETVRFEQIRAHHYGTHPMINPGGIVALQPREDLEAPHGRERLA